MDCKKYCVTYYIYDSNGNGERKMYMTVYSGSQYGAKSIVQVMLKDFNFLITNAEVIK